MINVLITGATGNVGLEVIKSLANTSKHLKIVAGLRDNDKNKQSLAGYDIEHVKFDFEDLTTFEPALRYCDILFLLRPPQLANVNKYFKPLIDIAKIANVKHIIFLSVQGVEKSTIIPHHKIEKLIRKSKMHFTFLRPAYFMQNFTTTLRKDLIENKRIFLPAGNAKFTLVDVCDIGKVASKIISENELHKDKIYELTSYEKLTFKEMAMKLTKILVKPIDYISPNLWRFYVEKRREKVPVGFILVMIMLHYLPRFQKEPQISDCIEKITGKQPITFEEFVENNKISLNGTLNKDLQVEKLQKS